MEMKLVRSQDRAPRKYMPEEYFELKNKIHDRLLNIIDLSLIDSIDQEILKSQIKVIAEKILRDESDSMPLNAMEREKLLREIQDEVIGFGPLEPFLQDPTISDILVTTHKKIYVERFGKLEPTDI